MDEFYDNTLITALEVLLSIKFRPTFLALTIDTIDGTIEVVMSCKQFETISISERTISVFNEIQKELPLLLQDHLVVLQCFDSKQMEQVLDDLFQI